MLFRSSDQALAFAAFATAAAMTPGPSNVMLTVTGAVAGLRRGAQSLAGVTVGMGLLMFLVSLGAGAIVTRFPGASIAMKGAGATFLLWLSWKVATAPYSAPEEARGQAAGFVGGFGLQWLNPKSWLVTTSAAGAYLTGSGNALWEAAALSGLFLIIVFLSGAVWVAFGLAIRRTLASARAQRFFNVTMAILLAGSVVLFVR